MRWDASCVPPHTIISADGTTASHSKSAWGTVRGDEVFSTGVVEIDIGCPNVDNCSLFLGVAEHTFFEHLTAAEQEEEEHLPRDSKHAICIHGDGRVFIKAAEKEWGLMRVATGDPVNITLDFDKGVITFRLSRTVRGKDKETIAEVPGLFRSGVRLICCFGGRDQEVSITRCDVRDTGDSRQRRVRDVFADAMGEYIAPVAFSAPQQAQTYEQQIIDMAKTLETSN